MLSSSARIVARRRCPFNAAAVSAVGRSRVQTSNAQPLQTFQARRTMAEMPVPRSSQAKLFGGHPKRDEDWKATVYFYYTAAAIMLIGIQVYAPDTEIESWAQKEAAARLHLKETGQVETFEFGKHYSDMVDAQTLDKFDNFTAKSINYSEDDDEDDDDDDDDDEDDDE